MIDNLTGYTLTSESDPSDYHKFSGWTLEMAYLYQDVSLINLATKLSGLLIEKDDFIGGVFFRIKNPAVKETVTAILKRANEISRFENGSKQKIEIKPTQEIKNHMIDIIKKLEKKMGENYACISLAPWQAGIAKILDEWSICLHNCKFTTEYGYLLTKPNTNTRLYNLLAPLLKWQQALDPSDMEICCDKGNIKITVYIHDHHYGVSRPKFFHDMGVTINLSFKRKTDAEKFWEEIITLGFEDFFLPGFRKLIFPPWYCKLQVTGNGS